MNFTRKRTLLLLLTLALLIGGLFPVLSVHAVGSPSNEVAPPTEGSSKQTQATIEKQIRAFADSIDQKNADDTAAMALATHGLTGGGKKLSVGKNHALTATLMNSELLQVVLIESCAPAIESMQNLKLKELNYVHGYSVWGLWEGSWGATNYEVRQYSSNQYTMPNIEYEIASGLMHSSKANAYDKSLEWMVSHAFITLTFRLVQVTDNEMTYQVTCEVDDRFDFDTSQGSGFGNLISGLAARLFKEFDWVSKFDFQLKVPNTCPHSGDFTSKVTKPTCAAKGYTTHTCSLCGYSYKDTYTAKTDHKFGSWKKTADPTCEDKGTETRTCSACGTAETRPIDALGHSYTSAVTPPTCTVQGYASHTCSLCGHNYKDTYTAQTDHKFGSWKKTADPTCEDKGTETRTCSACGTAETRSIAALGHSYTSTVTPPTCTAQGFTTYTCHCGNSYTDSYVNKLRHTMGEWIVDKAPTCTTGGSKIRKCSDCDYFETDAVEALGHSYEPVVTAPTCTENGYTTHTCHCGGSAYVDSYVNATGHTMGEWVVAEAPTCTTEGSKIRKCSDCDYFETDAVEALGHSYEPVVTAPTCTKQGYTTYTCRCRDTYVDSYVNEIEHVPSDWIIDLAPEPNVEGSMHKECTVCREILETDVIEALPEVTVPETPPELETEPETETDTETESEHTVESTTDDEEAIPPPAKSDYSETILLSAILLLIAILPVITIIVMRKKKHTCC